MPEAEKKTADKIAQLVVFRLGAEEFGVDILSVREITRVVDITHVPRAPSFVKGVINLRGRIVAVVDLRGQFGLPPAEKPSGKSKIVVAEVGDQTIGVLVDDVPEVVKIPLESIEPAPDLVRTAVKRDYIRGVGKLGARLIILLDLEKALAPGRIRQLAGIGGKGNGLEG